MLTQVRNTLLEDIAIDDMVALGLRVRPSWTQVRSVARTETTKCRICFIEHTILTSQICGDCASAGPDETHPEMINDMECEVLKCSSKQYRYNRGCTITTKNESGRILVGTVFENRIELYNQIIALNKGDKVTLVGWFNKPFPKDEEDGEIDSNHPDGFIDIEQII